MTIEILSTDAEGRLVLADGLVYTARQGADELIDLATLTGAVVVALGEGSTGLFSNNDELASRLLAAADQAGEVFGAAAEAGGDRAFPVAGELQLVGVHDHEQVEFGAVAVQVDQAAADVVDRCVELTGLLEVVQALTEREQVEVAGPQHARQCAGRVDVARGLRREEGTQGPLALAVVGGGLTAVGDAGAIDGGATGEVQAERGQQRVDGQYGDRGIVPHEAEDQPWPGLVHWGPSRTRFRIRDQGGSETVLTFSRDGIFAWKLSHIGLPEGGSPEGAGEPADGTPQAG